MRDSATEADRLNEKWDELVSGKEVPDEVDIHAFGLYVLLEADAETPAPDPQFVGSLRAVLTKKSDPPVTHVRGRESLGIVAHPFALGLDGNQRPKWAVLFVIAAMLAIAVLSTGLTLRAGGRPEIGLPTAQASVLVPTSTPMAQSTAVIRAQE